MMKTLLWTVLALMAVSVTFVSLAGNADEELTNTEFSVEVADFIKTYHSGNIGTKGHTEESNPFLPGIIGRTNGHEIDFSVYSPADFALCKDGRFFLKFNDLSKLQGCLRSLEVNPHVIYAIQDELVYSNEDNQKDLQATDHLSWGPSQLEVDSYAEYLSTKETQDLSIVAVIDSGAAALDFNSERLIQGYDFVDNDFDTTNDTHPSSHGTFLSSIIVDCTPNLPVKVMPVRVLSSITGSLMNIINGIYYAVDEGADVINISLGGKLRDCQAVDDAILYAYAHNVSVVVCSGNEHDDTKAYCPAHNSTAITVSAVNSDLSFASGFSNYGNEVDVCAPGVDILGYNSRGTLKSDSGTSMSAAFISACVAMMKLEYPYLNPVQIDTLLKSASMDLGDEGKDLYYGWGFPKLDRLTKMATVPVSGIQIENVLELRIGEIHQISYKLYPENASDQEVHWRSSDEGVATVSEGFVQAVSVGRATIEVRTNDGGYSAFCNIVIHPSHPNGLSIISLPNKLSYRYGEPLNLDGLVLEAQYSDGLFLLVNIADCEISGYDAKRVGDQQVVVNYQGQQVVFSIRVNRSWWQKILRVLFFIWLFEQ